MTDIFREVEEEVRRERFEKLWKQYGHYAIAGVVAIVVAIGGYQLWIRYEQGQREQNAAEYMAAMQLADSGKPLDAAAKLGEIAKNGTGGYKTIAKLAQGDALLAGNKRQEALAVYKEVAESGGNKQLADVARIRAAWIMVESAPQTELRDVLEPLTDASSVWRFMASEILAYSSFVGGQMALSQQAYERLAADTAAPAGIRERSRMMAQFIASGAGQDFGSVPPPPKPAATETAPATSPATTPNPAP